MFSLLSNKSGKTNDSLSFFQSHYLKKENELKEKLLTKHLESKRGFNNTQDRLENLKKCLEDHLLYYDMYKKAINFYKEENMSMDRLEFYRNLLKMFLLLKGKIDSSENLIPVTLWYSESCDLFILMHLSDIIKICKEKINILKSEKLIKFNKKDELDEDNDRIKLFEEFQFFNKLNQEWLNYIKRIEYLINKCI